MIRHKSTANVMQFDGYGRKGAKHSVSSQFRFLVRLAVACDAAKVDYDVQWFTRQLPHEMGFRLGATDENRKWLECQPRATITVTADKIPAAKPLPKAPAERRVADWKPRFHEAEYKLNACVRNIQGTPQPGFVIAHSSGLGLVCPSDSGEWGDNNVSYQDADPTGKKWRVTHLASGRGFGIETSLQRATKALLLAASFDVDWTQPIEALAKLIEPKRVMNEVLAAFGTAHQKNSARSSLRSLAHAAEYAALEQELEQTGKVAA